MKKKVIAIALFFALITLFTACDGKEISNQFENTEVGDTITFGSYADEQIEWQVLKINDNQIMLITKYGIETKAYNSEKGETTWEQCSLREWLNVEFYNNAFTSDEKKIIMLNNIKNNDNPLWGTEGGKDTKDYVYLLSMEEVTLYFHGEAELACIPTKHAVENGAWVLSQEELDCFENKSDYSWAVGTGWWWLRSPGDDVSTAADILYYTLDYFGTPVHISDGCVRPVIVIQVSNS